MKRNIAPGWWMIPGAVLGLVLYALAGMVVAHVIWRDGGGGLVTYARAVEAGPPAEIRGVCASACTMQLHNSCVWPDAVLGFHGPSRRDPPLSTHNAARSSAVMAAITRPRWRSGS